MVVDEKQNLPFSQRNGFAPVPPQLQIGEISPKLRRLLWYAVHKDIQTSVGGHPSTFSKRWRVLARDLWVLFFEQMPENFTNRAERHAEKIRKIVTNGELGNLFDLVEFLIRHDHSSMAMIGDVTNAFIDARAAYRVIDRNTIIAIGSNQEADAVLRAIQDTEQSSAVGARTHLIDSGKALREGDWSGSIRESIHAIEAVTTQLAPDKKTLGSALAQLERSGHLHGALKGAFSQLYGFTSDEEGVRHSLVVTAQVVGR